MRAAIIGCGRIAGGYNDADDSRVLTHAEAYRRLGVPLVGCCDLDAPRTEAFARRWGVGAWSADLGGLLAATSPDVVSVCVPADRRLDILACVLSAPSVRAVLLEKPIAAEMAETTAIADLVEQSGVRVLVNYSRAFDPFYSAVARDIRRGAHGTVHQVVARYYGSARTNASHLIERVLDMLGEPAPASRLAGSAREPVFVLRFRHVPAEALFLPTPGCEYAPCELDLLCHRERIRIVDSEHRVERFVSHPDEDFAGFFNLAPTPAADPGGPSRESMLHAVEATLAAAGGLVHDEGIFLRSVLVDRVLDQIGAS